MEIVIAVWSLFVGVTNGTCIGILLFPTKPLTARQITLLTIVPILTMFHFAIFISQLD